MRFKYCGFLGLLVLLVGGCSTGDNTPSDANVVFQKLKVEHVDNLIGYWQNQDNSFGIEFHPSHFTTTFTVGDLKKGGDKTGRIVSGDQSTIRYFYWNLSDNGNIELVLKSTECNRLPISTCVKGEIIQIELKGENLKNASWTLQSDQNIDGIIGNNKAYKLTKRKLSLDVAEGNPVYLKISENFDYPIKLYADENGFQIKFPFPDNPVEQFTFTAMLHQVNEHEIVFNDLNNYNFISEEKFYSKDNNLQTFKVRNWIDNVKLTKSFSNNLVLTYKQNKEIVDISATEASQINLSNFNKNKTRTLIGTIAYVQPLQIETNVRYYTLLPINLIAETSSTPNEFILFDDGTGEAHFEDMFEGKNSQKQNFEWNKNDNNEITLDLGTSGIITISVLESITGGYNVLFKNESIGLLMSHDMLTDGEVDIDLLLPGLFELENTNGLSKVFVEFKEDNTLVINADPIMLSGYWFKDKEGSIVSFECIDINGTDVNSFQECYDSFNNINGLSQAMLYSHLRKFKFLHKNGNELVSKYDAVAWGGPFGKGNKYKNFSWVYRWKRLSN